MGEIVQVEVVGDEAVGDDMYRDPGASGRRAVLLEVVAHHQAFLALEAEPLEHLGEIPGIGLTEGAFGVGSHIVKVLGREADPAEPAFHSAQGIEGIGGEDHPLRSLLGQRHQLPGGGIFPGDGAHLVEGGAVEGIKVSGGGAHVLPHGLGEGVPEPRFVGSGAVVAHHGHDAVPDAADHSLGREMGQLLAEQVEIGFRIDLQIHGQKRTVQIEEDCRALVQWDPILSEPIIQNNI